MAGFLDGDSSLRVCPGIHLAERVTFLLATTLISLYKIGPLEGKDIPDPRTIEYEDRAIRWAFTLSHYSQYGTDTYDE
jgi:hypothetical protein